MTRETNLEIVVLVRIEVSLMKVSGLDTCKQCGHGQILPKQCNLSNMYAMRYHLAYLRVQCFPRRPRFSRFDVVRTGC